MKKLFLSAFILVAAILSFFVLRSGDAAENETPGEMPPMAVSTYVVQPEQAIIWNEFTGRIEPVAHAVIKPEVSGRITEVNFEDGSEVNVGDTLFVIDPAPLMASLKEAEAALDIARSEAALAETEYQRARKLRESDAISEGLFEERTRNRNNAAGAVKAAKALRDSAKINLDYAYIKAPIAGKTSRAELTVGNRVEAGSSAPVLTEIIQHNPLYAEFDIDEQTFIRIKTALTNASETPVRMRVDGTDTVFDGTIHSFDNKISVGSGTVRARALFENKDDILLPGMTADINVGLADEQLKILIPQSAIGTDQDRKFVYIMNDENTIEYRPVSLGATLDTRRVVLSGLSEGEKLITSSIIKLRPGSPVSEKQDPDDSHMDAPSELAEETAAPIEPAGE